MIGTHDKLTLTEKEFISRLYSEMLSYKQSKQIKESADKLSKNCNLAKVFMADMPKDSAITWDNESQVWYVICVTYESKRWGDDCFIGKHSILNTAIKIAWLSWNMDKQIILE